jgi:hypothetical protein
MNRFIIYTKLRLKAVLKIFPSMCVMTLLLCLSLGGMLYLQSASSLQIAEGDEDATVSIGISGVGGGAQVSRLLGEKNPEAARRVSSFSLWFALLTGLLFSLAVLLFMDPLMRLLGAKADILTVSLSAVVYQRYMTKNHMYA